MKAIIITAFLALAGCASSSGVFKTGPETFTVTATASPGAGGSAKAKSSAYSDATKECAKDGRTVEAVADTSSAPGWTDGMHTVNLIFKCVKTGA